MMMIARPTFLVASMCVSGIAAVENSSSHSDLQEECQKELDQLSRNQQNTLFMAYTKNLNGNIGNAGLDLIFQHLMADETEVEDMTVLLGKCGKVWHDIAVKNIAQHEDSRQQYVLAYTAKKNLFENRFLGNDDSDVQIDEFRGPGRWAGLVNQRRFGNTKDAAKENAWNDFWKFVLERNQTQDWDFDFNTMWDAWKTAKGHNEWFKHQGDADLKLNPNGKPAERPNVAHGAGGEW